MCLKKIKHLKEAIRNLKLLLWDVTTDLRLSQFRKTVKSTYISNIWRFDFSGLSQTTTYAMSQPTTFESCCNLPNGRSAMRSA